MDGDHTAIQDRQNSNINLYIGCEKDGNDAIASSVDGTVVRFNLIDSAGTWVLFDYPLGAGGDFDSLTHTWIHVMMTVTRHSVKAFMDGSAVADADFGFPTGSQCEDMHIRPTCEQLVASPQYTCATSMEVLTGSNPQYAGQTLADYCQSSCHQCTGPATGGSGGAVDSGMLSNSAYPYPSVLRKLTHIPPLPVILDFSDPDKSRVSTGDTLADFDLQSQIFIGARSDLEADRHFLGHMALLKIYSSPVSNAEASCIFHDGEQILVDVGADGGGHRRLAALAAAAEADAAEAEEKSGKDHHPHRPDHHHDPGKCSCSCWPTPMCSCCGKQGEAAA